MKDVMPGSRSHLLRATHILVVRIEKAKAGEWARGPSGVTRTVEVEAKLEEVYKGSVAEPVGSVIAVSLAQHGTGSSRVAAVPGAWSNHDIDAGARFVVLAVTGSEAAATILRDPACQAAIPAAEALPDVQLAAQTEDQALDVAGAVALARQVAPQLGFLFADYLWARYGGGALADEKNFDPIADLLEQPSLSALARGTLVPMLVAAVTSPEPPPAKQVSRLAVAFFHLLSMPEAQALHDNLVGTYLPALLDVGEPHARRPADVFHDYPGELARARAAVQGYKGSQPAAPLLAWLAR